MPPLHRLANPYTASSAQTFFFYCPPKFKCHMCCLLLVSTAKKTQKCMSKSHQLINKSSIFIFISSIDKKSKAWRKLAGAGNDPQSLRVDRSAYNEASCTTLAPHSLPSNRTGGEEGGGVLMGRGEGRDGGQLTQHIQAGLGAWPL